PLAAAGGLGPRPTHPPGAVSPPAATEVLAEQGFSRTTREQICARAGLPTQEFDARFDSVGRCYAALLDEFAAAIRDRVSTTALRKADRPFGERGPAIVAAFVHAIAEDPRLLRLAFTEVAQVPSVVRRQRRVHRRWAAAFLDTQWPAEPGVGERTSRRRFAVAMATIGGVFELVADWSRHHGGIGGDSAQAEDDAWAAQALIDDLTEFVGVVYAGRVAARRASVTE
ncbi:TetR/AcrR family transcriptional regulator, partial [Nocardia farcinica]|uniref:TetR/AcrR family transcriptional regulator n=1 Tax=Nocardia farcinica TaxID=37329 RepID=UPI0024566E33